MVVEWKYEALQVIKTLLPCHKASGLKRRGSRLVHTGKSAVRLLNEVQGATLHSLAGMIDR